MVCVNLGYTTVDHIDPNAEKTFPYVYVGEQFNQGSIDNKTYALKTTQVTLHIIHDDYRKRGTLTQIIGDIENALWNLRSTGRFSITPTNTNTNILETDFPSLHGTLEVEYRYY